MSPTERETLHEIAGEVGEVRGMISAHVSDFRLFVTKMMGDDTAELPEGRVPRLESGQKDHERRLTRIERAGFMAAGGLMLFKGVAWLAEFLYHLTGAIRK